MLNLELYLVKTNYLFKKKNIDIWPKQGWEAFVKFVNNKAETPTKTAVKRSKIPGKSISLIDDAKWLVVVPLDKDASCFHGRGTDWCTTKPGANYFEHYFYNRAVTLIYCIQKATGAKWALAVHKNAKTIECFDQFDCRITSTEFNKETGLNAHQIRDLALSNSHNPGIIASRETYASALKTIKSFLRIKYPTPKLEIEKLLLFTKNSELARKYFIKTQSLNPEIHKLCVTGSCHFLENLLNTEFEIQPTEELLVAAVSSDGGAIEFLIDYGFKPTEKVQLAAVTYNGYAIQDILNAKIKPSEAVQLAAVKQNGAAIECIIDAKIKPSEQVRLVAKAKR